MLVDRDNGAVLSSATARIRPQGAFDAALELPSPDPAAPPARAWDVKVAVVGALRGWLPGRTRGARPVEVPASVALPALDGLEPYRTRNGNLSLRPATEADDDGAATRRCGLGRRRRLNPNDVSCPRPRSGSGSGCLGLGLLHPPGLTLAGLVQLLDGRCDARAALAVTHRERRVDAALELRAGGIAVLGDVDDGRHGRVDVLDDRPEAVTGVLEVARTADVAAGMTRSASNWK